LLCPVTFSGERLRAAREAAGLSREHVAIELHRGMLTVARWETGHVSPNAAQLAELSRVLGVEVGELFAPVEGGPA
jgi:transcriptional regulator with XRE-family HTH domain